MSYSIVNQWGAGQDGIHNLFEYLVDGADDLDVLTACAAGSIAHSRTDPELVWYRGDDSVWHRLVTGSRKDPQREYAGIAIETLMGALLIMRMSANDLLIHNADIESATLTDALSELIASMWSYQGLYSSDKTYKKWNYVTDGIDAYLYINNAPAKGKPLENTTYWAKVAGKGDTGNSAYDAAVDAGYKGTEEEFNDAMAALPTTIQDAQDAADAASAAAEEAQGLITRLGGLSFEVDPVDGGLNIIYTPE